MVRESGSESDGQKKSCAFFHEKEEVQLKQKHSHEVLGKNFHMVMTNEICYF